MDTTAGKDPTGRGAVVLAGIVLIGCAVAVGLGVFERIHAPTGHPLFTIGSWSLPQTKSVLASVAMTLGLVQVVTASAMYGKLGPRGTSPRIALLHRTSGVAAVLVSLPVAMQCLWVLGFDDKDTRVLVHSLAGCAFYGIFVTKMLALRTSAVPRWAVPILGGLLFTVLVTLWLTSAYWYFTY